MQVLDFLHGKLARARKVLRELIDHYEGMENSERMGKSTTIMDAINSYLQIKENLILPYMINAGQYRDLVEKVCAVHGDIENITERSIMIHVDEHGGDFYNNMVRLDALLAEAERTDKEILFPWCEVHLKEEDQRYIAEHLADQMTQESLPSSGLTSY